MQFDRITVNPATGKPCIETCVSPYPGYWASSPQAKRVIPSSPPIHTWNRRTSTPPSNTQPVSRRTKWWN